MTPISIAAEELVYQMAVIDLYLDLPETPQNASVSDRQQALRWREQRVPLGLVQTALILGSLRRLSRPAGAPPLAGIRSLAYFRPVVQELLVMPVGDTYRLYLQRQIRPYLRSQPGAQDVLS